MTRAKKFLLSGILIGAGAIVGVLTILVVFAPAKRTSGVPATYKSLNLFGDVYERVVKDYVDKPDEKLLIQSALSWMVSHLDRYSSYMNDKTFQEMKSPAIFGGVGIEMAMDGGLIRVVAPIEGGGAAKAGILANDIITRVDDMACTRFR